MKKFKAFLLGALIIIGFIFLSWFLYQGLDSTMAIIIDITLLMIGLMIAITVVNRSLNKNAKIEIDIHHYPTIEKDLLPVRLEGFCEKLKRYKGSLYLIDPEHTAKDITIVSGTYNKLTDKLLLKFSNGLQTEVSGAQYIEVGDYQFLLRKFDYLTHAKGKKKIVLHWKRSKLVQLRGDENLPIKVHQKAPIFVFDWSDYPEQNEDFTNNNE